MIALINIVTDDEVENAVFVTKHHSCLGFVNFNGPFCGILHGKKKSPSLC